MFRRQERFAIELLQSYWEAVEMVASALLKDGTLTGADGTVWSKNPTLARINRLAYRHVG
jgi:hypothetical protein